MFGSLWIFSLVGLILFEGTEVTASIGDRSPFFQKCVHKCSFSNCTNDEGFRVPDIQPVHLKLLSWSCHDECRYNCMWTTVESFTERGWDVPQFNGKWPFVRVLGIQELASTVFSIMNFLAHSLMLMRFRKEVRKQSPLYWLWHVYAAICLNAWLWSTVFHSRDSDFTERMDYFCAFSMVLFSFYAMVVRFLYGKTWSKGLTGILSVVCLSGFIYHVSYLYLVHFDYGYNMLANIFVGVANGVGWLVWSLRRRHNQPYVWRCALFVLLAGLCMLFEVADTPPLFWLVDTHALWHLGTAFLPLIFYRFLIDDCKYLRKKFLLETTTIPLKVKSN